MIGACACGKPLYATGKCEACYGKAYREKHRNKARQYAKAWHARNPEKQAGYYHEFYLRNTRRILETNAAYYAANPDVRKANKHRRRAKESGNGGSWTRSEWAALKRQYKNRCLRCGKTERHLRKLNRKLVPDHVLPISKGGRNDVGNLQPLCHGVGGCNNHKANKHLDYRENIGSN